MTPIEERPSGEKACPAVQVDAAACGGHPAKVLLDLAVTLTLGGDCLADVAVLRSEPGVYGRVASGPTVSRTIDAGEERQPWRQLGERPCFQK